MVRVLTKLLKDPEVGKFVVPIVPDEARTFGMDALFKVAGIYSPDGQRYTPVDAEALNSYREAIDGQILQEGICEAGAIASFIAAGTAYATFAVPTIPFYIFYSMFGFQRVGDMIWASADMMARGFLLGGTAGRTTLNGEGLQHQDGHSPILASTVPSVRTYDPAFAWELAILVQYGISRMFIEDHDELFYLMMYNEALPMPPRPELSDLEAGVIRGGYCLKPLWVRGRVLTYLALAPSCLRSSRRRRDCGKRDSLSRYTVLPATSNWRATPSGPHIQTRPHGSATFSVNLVCRLLRHRITSVPCPE